ncbi:hypothetical protein [Thioalkalivibrio thiocyanodenitrificans]|uniref:hypothetical protein n=1 Tax=Thioalkalivibrio thiocyanodenitrificans TaxID=243063 RepID=UPI00035DBF22|nr:hypothetical protein [Thioalkalivibrio thiocyanodenitrificans]
MATKKRKARRRVSKPMTPGETMNKAIEKHAKQRLKAEAAVERKQAMLETAKERVAKAMERQKAARSGAQKDKARERVSVARVARVRAKIDLDSAVRALKQVQRVEKQVMTAVAKLEGVAEKDLKRIEAAANRRAKPKRRRRVKKAA